MKVFDSLPENYRSISLLAVGYKVLASLILLRLKDGGCESRLRKTQFGFRANHSTTDAIFLVQRQIEKAWAAKTGQLSIVLLDWAKACDKVSRTTLLEALLKFRIH